MSIALGIALYFVIWWTTLFAVLPIGMRTQGEAGDVVPGTPPGAPVRPQILRIMLINTAVAAVVFTVVIVAVRSGWIPLDLASPGDPTLPPARTK
jgi:predicted secreted protein